MLRTLQGLSRQQWSAVVASFLGWTLDAFDFSLIVFMFTAIAREFHADVPGVAVASALTLAARPFGALVFGLMADRYGRRPVLMADVLAFSLFELASAFAPTLLVLMILRALFGFAMGGEWGVGASLAMESIPARARGVVSGLLQAGYGVGYLLASLAYFALFDRIGWRGLFIVGAAPALLVGFIRLGVRESPAFEARRAAATHARVGWVWGLAAIALMLAVAPALVGAAAPGRALLWVYAVDAPIALAGLFIFRRHWRLALYLVALMSVLNAFSHGTEDLYPTFLQTQHGLATAPVGLITALSWVGGITGGIGFGALSERLGRRRTMAAAALLGLIVIPLWAFSRPLAVLALGGFAMQFMVGGAWGMVPTHLNELSPADQRGAFPGYLYQVGNLLASGLAVWQAQVAKTRGGDYALALAITAAVVSVAIAALILAGPERRGADLGSTDV